jgi:hypothetical protein
MTTSDKAKYLLIALKNFTYGGLTLLPGVPRNLAWQHTGGTVSARYCYAVWLRHLIKIHAASGSLPASIAEIGPGDSIGIGLAELLSGVERYQAFDIVRYSNLQSSISIYDELISLFRARAPIPDESEFPQVKPELADYTFPSHILTDAILNSALSERRLNHLRKALNEGGDRALLWYQVPWSNLDIVKAESVDLIFSQAVMEHIDDIDCAYAAMNNWLSPRGYIGHQIDFRSHDLLQRWDGMRALRSWQWRLLRGRRPYLINRVSCQGHLDALMRNGFNVVDLIRFERDPEVTREQLAPEFRDLDERERRTAGAYILASKGNH